MTALDATKMLYARALISKKLIMKANSLIKFRLIYEFR